MENFTIFNSIQNCFAIICAYEKIMVTLRYDCNFLKIYVKFVIRHCKCLSVIFTYINSFLMVPFKKYVMHNHGVVSARRLRQFQVRNTVRLLLLYFYPGCYFKCLSCQPPSAGCHKVEGVRYGSKNEFKFRQTCSKNFRQGAKIDFRAFRENQKMPFRRSKIVGKWFSEK